jgi:hypothetical protein
MDPDQDLTSAWISIAHCRELLGEEAAVLSDVEIEQIRRHADALARVIIDVFLAQRSRSE